MGVPSRTSAPTPALDQTSDIQIILGKVRPLSRPHTEAHPQVLIIAPGDSAHFANIYGAWVSKETISRITNKVIQEMNDWAVRPPDAPYAAIFIDAMVVQGPRRPSRQVALPRRHRGQPNLGGERDILGLWAGTGRKGAKFWMSVLTDLRNRVARDLVRQAREAGVALTGPRTAQGDDQDGHRDRLG